LLFVWAGIFILEAWPRLRSAQSYFVAACQLYNAVIVCVTETMKPYQAEHQIQPLQQKSLQDSSFFERGIFADSDVTEPQEVGVY
jgi:hypothetical protein